MICTKKRVSSVPERKQWAIIDQPSTLNSANATYQLGDYVIGRTIGFGTFGKVKVACHRVTKNAVAVKFLCRKKVRELGVAEKIIQEILNHDELHHPHITKLYLALSCPTHIIMVMEYVDGGELFAYIVGEGRLTESESRRLFQQIISAVDYLHRHQIVHRDLKPENILLTKLPHRSVKLADFGLSKYLEDGELLNTSCGSPNYAAPEVVSGSLYLGPEVDIWSAGVILYAMLTGSLPFSDESLPALFKKIEAGVFAIPHEFSSDVIQLIKHMLTVDPRKRATAHDILHNPWFRVELPAYLFAPVTKIISDAELNGHAIEEASERFGIDEHQIMDAVLTMHDTAGDRIRQEVEKIAAWMSNESRRNRSKCKRSVVNANKLPAQKLRWHLGVRSVSDPVDIMLKVYDVLKALNFEWHSISPYQLTIRPKAGDNKLTIGLNLYQVELPMAVVGYILDLKLIAIGSRDPPIAPASSSRSSSISSGPNGPSRKSSAFSEIFRRRASSYEHQMLAKEAALQLNLKRWESCSENAEETVTSLNLVDLLQNFQLGGSDSYLETSNEPENLQSELLSFFDNCAKLIHDLMNGVNE